MAQVLPAKRPRGLTDHHRAPVNGIAGLSRSKRPRHSIVEPNERSYSEDVESRHPEDEEASSNGLSDEDDTAALVRATQVVERSFRESAKQQNTPAEAGILEEIRCTNFMCHEQLTVPLGPLINFIIGHNGSGKSAVLTAITLCLGGKATATNRGQNLRSFIKEGRDFSVLSVKIKNQGPSAYAPEQYGDSIIVERHFNRSGSSAFKLKDRNGKIVSTKKAELEDIIDAFALQIDNPMNVLTQDMARQFLHESSPKDKYKFFLKGTQLETLSRDYNQIAQELEEQESRAQTLHGDLEVFRKNYEKAKQKAKSATKLEQMRADEITLAHQAAWAQVESEEKELTDIDARLEHISEIIERKKAEADIQSEQYAHADQDFHSAEEAVQECQAEKQPADDEVNECKAKWEETKKTIFNLKSTERQIVGALNTSKKSLQDTQSQIQDHRERQAQADNGIHAQKAQEFEEAKAIYEQCKAAWENHDGSLAALNEQLNGARVQKKQLEGKLQQKRTEEQQSRTKIRSLEQGQRRWLDSYRNPAALEKLMRAVENERRFQERPVGPMGRYVELTKPEWGYILEKQFGRALDAFVVTSKADHSVLTDLQKRYNYHTPILISTTKDPIDTSAHEPDKQLLTWMRALKITNNLVRNQLIVNQSIDQVVLIQNREEAWEFMNRPGPERANVKMCYCMADKTRRAGHFITVSQKTGGSNLGPIDEYRFPFRMQADKGTQIQEEKDNLANIQQQMRDIEAQASVAQDDLNACQARIQDHKRQKRDLKMQMDQAQEDRDTLEDELNTSTTDAAVIEQLEKELVDAQGQLNLNEEQYQDFTIQMDKANEQARSHKAQLEAATKVLQEVELRLDKEIAKVQTRTQRREQALRAKNQALGEVEEAENTRSEWTKTRDEQKDTLKSMTEDAKSISARVEVPPGETFDSLTQRRERLIKERERSQNELGGSEEELLRKAIDAKKIYIDAAKEMNGTEHVRRVLKVALNTRQERWKRFRQEISVRARVTFNYLLSERQFRGTLGIDHTNHRLDIHVQPDITVASNAVRQTKTLSGGEKSFSTICLLLALWDAMGSPIRCLDEFDVFMDVANREITMKMIVGAARRAIGRQYILITPQGVNSKHVGNSEDVKIIRMADPERGQTALDFRG